MSVSYSQKSVFIYYIEDEAIFCIYTPKRQITELRNSAFNAFVAKTYSDSALQGKVLSSGFVIRFNN